jgi:PAS domain S-box-containing protein
MASALEKKIRVAVTILFAVLVASGLASYRATRTLLENEASVAHTDEVISEIERVLSTLKDAETGERGYIITGADTYLEPYEAALTQIDAQVRHLEMLTADNPRQQARIPLLERKISDRLDGLKTGINLRRSGDIEGAHQLIQGGSGKRMMDDLRKFIDEMEAEENNLLQQRAEESRISARDTNLTFVIGNLAALGLLLVIGYIINRDVAARAAAEQELRDQRQLLQVTLASIGDGVIASGPDGLVTFLNPVAEQLTGWTNEEAEGRPLSEVFNIINEQTRETVENPALRAIRQGTIVGLANHTVLKTKRGGEIAIDDAASPIKTPGGKVLGAVLIFRDVTARRRAEEERSRLIASEQNARAQAEAANRTKDEFLATLSHELRTPLTAIYGWVEILKHSELDDKKITRALEVIDRNVKAQTQLVDDLLNVSRIITGNLKMEMDSIDPLPVARSAIESLRPAIEAKSIELVTHLDENVGAIFADPARWQQVLWNLFTNALKFTPKGGQIRVDFGRVGSWVQLTVTDTGEGIDPAFLPYVFERFTQADSTSTRRHGGLGLGLAIVRHIVELHGGKIMVYSEGRDKGSTFIVQLPVPAVHQPQRHAPGVTSTTDLTGLRVMLVEDDDDTREVVAATLDRYGASVIEAASAAEALRLLLKEIPDVLVTDIGMPGMDGYELLSKIRSEYRQYVIPAVALTAFASPEDRQKALQAGFRAHISKPITTEELIAAIGASRQTT